jgi:putative ABC transport system substrate-binding protein
MMDRRAFIGRITAGFLAAPLVAAAQQAGRIYRVGYLSAGSREVYVDAFVRELRLLGWIESQNLAFEYRWAKGKYERLPALAAELVQSKVDVIVAPTEPAAVAAKNATQSVPIVMIFIGDPFRSKLVASLARPGGNVTGTTFTPSLELLGKRLDLLKEAVPQASRVAVLSNPANPSHALELSEVEAAARRLKVQLQRLDARIPEEIERAFNAMARERADAALVLVDSMFASQRTRLAELALKYHLPTMQGVREFVTAGGLMAYGINLVEFVKGAAHYVDKLLRGAKAADRPVEQPTKFELVINLKTAKALGLTMPPALLLRADQVIE